MKHENVKKLLSLMANYVENVALECNVHYALEEIRTFLREQSNVASVPLSNKDKEKMYWETVHALNSGEEDAKKRAFIIRLRALISGDDKLIEKIEYLHDVI